MPQRRQRRTRWGRRGCPRRLAGFLHPCLLRLLHQGDAHGYDLIQRLDAFGFDASSLNPDLVYRLSAGWSGRGMWRQTDERRAWARRGGSIGSPAREMKCYPNGSTR